MSGTLITYTRAPGRPDLSRLSPASMFVRKVPTGVMVASELVQASLAPISTVTYCTPRETALLA